MRTPTRFARNARVMFIGDSITCNGGFMSVVQEYYLTHFPEDRVKCFNAGVSGGGVGSAHRFLDADVDFFRPTETVIMLGMNDVGRHLYFNDAQDGKTVRTMAGCDRAYFEGMLSLCERLVEKGLPFTICTPSPFDDQMECEQVAGRNLATALRGYGHFCLGLAERYGAPTVDFNTPMTEIDRTLQETDRTRSLIGTDRVHPTPVGHAVMGNLFLRAQGFTEVEEPTAEGVLAERYEIRLSPKNAERVKYEKGSRELRNSAWFLLGEDWQAPTERRLARIAKFMADEEAGVPHHPYVTSLARAYPAEMDKEQPYRERLMEISESLYD